MHEKFCHSLSCLQHTNELTKMVFFGTFYYLIVILFYISNFTFYWILHISFFFYLCIGFSPLVPFKALNKESSYLRMLLMNSGECHILQKYVPVLLVPSLAFSRALKKCTNKRFNKFKTESKTEMTQSSSNTCFLVQLPRWKIYTWSKKHTCKPGPNITVTSKCQVLWCQQRPMTVMGHSLKGGTFLFSNRRFDHQQCEG